MTGDKMFGDKIESLLTSATGGRIGLRAFQAELPELSQQMIRDRGCTCLEQWAESLNYDDKAKARITDRKILNAIGRLVHYPIRRGTAYHAGLMHTYGYMLSRLETPYGLKHERWTSGTLEKGLKLPAGILLDLGGQSSLLQNVTFLFCTLTGVSLESSPASHIHTDLQNHDFTAVPNPTVIREKVEIQGGERFELNSHICHFSAPNENAALLIYSTRKNDQPSKLVTGFPISQDSLGELLDEENMGFARSLRLRYNAHIEGFPAEAFGSREIIQQESRATQ